MQRTDRDLIEAAIGGDIRSFDELVSRYADAVYAFAARLSGDRAAADDAAQETFIKAWKARRKYDPEKSFKPWLFAIARNATIDVMRKKRDASFSSFATVDDDDSFADSVADETIAIGADFDRSILNKTLEEVIQTLTSDQRAAVLLHDVEGMTFDEAGKAMGKPLNTVKSHYRRAIIALRKRLEERGYAPNDES